MLKAGAGQAAGHEKLPQHPFVIDDAALKLRGYDRFPGHTAPFKHPQPNELSRDLTLLGFRGQHGLSRLVTEEKFYLVPCFARDSRAQLLIEPVALSRDFTDGE